MFSEPGTKARHKARFPKHELSVNEFFAGPGHGSVSDAPDGSIVCCELTFGPSPPLPSLAMRGCCEARADLGAGAPAARGGLGKEGRGGGFIPGGNYDNAAHAGAFAAPG